MTHWMAAGSAAALLFGFALGWFVFTRSIHSNIDRLDERRQELETRVARSGEELVSLVRRGSVREHLKSVGQNPSQ